MTISQRQYDILNEIGIDLWQSKLKNIAPAHDKDIVHVSQEVLSDLLQQQLFQDILRSMSLTPEELKLVNGALDLGLINWQFSESLNCTYSNQCLTTPSLDIIQTSVALKRELWLIIREFSA